MCGIAGFMAPLRSEQAEQVLRSMTDAVAHRGPDGAGLWRDEEQGVALGHRRLAIIDLSPVGGQPMRSQCGRYVLIYNGEIYNHHQLRAELLAAGWSLKGRSDTEAMLETISRLGIRQTLPKLNGMFALALWDRQELALHLVRDRLGEKPLYWGQHGDRFVFGSELKALRAFPGFPFDLDHAALSAYLQAGCIPAPLSIYRQVRKLEPGTMLTVQRTESGWQQTTERYWSLPGGLEAAGPFGGAGEAEVLDQVHQGVLRAVRLRMEADVPLGAFLSGGIDSGLVVAAMQAQSDRAVRTYTIGFPDAAHDEAPHARRVAQHLGTDHTELYVTASDGLALVPSLPRVYDEPFADWSQIPTMLVAHMARRHVTVSLSGDGGDELFGGYNRHRLIGSIWRRTRHLPRPARLALRSALHLLSPRAWSRLFGWGERLARRSLVSLPGQKMQKLADLLACDTPAQIYRSLVSAFPAPGRLLAAAAAAPAGPGAAAQVTADPRSIMLADAATYLPDDILTKVDRATMSVGLESRAPYLDHTFVELAFQVPTAYKLREGQSKWLLRRLLGRYLPADLIDRPKAGFYAPVGDWLRGELRDWAQDLLAPERLRREAILNPEPVAALLREHLSGRRNREQELWTLLMFQAWLQEQSRPAEGVSG